MRKVVIIIPNHNNHEGLKKAIESIYETVRYPAFRIIINDSESDEATQQYLKEVESSHDNITVMHTPKQGITSAINQAIKTTQPNEDIFLTQNDVTFINYNDECWLSKFVKAAESDIMLGLITANKGGALAGPDYIDGYAWFGTWALYIKRETLEKVGLLDENFNPGPGDDIDYSYRVDCAGLKRGMLSVQIDHHRDTEHYNDDLEEVIKRNAAYFRLKHDADILNFVNDELKKFTLNDVYLDVGANYGLYSIAINNGVAFCFEACQSIYDVLVENTKKNHRIYCFNEAVYSDVRNFSIEENMKQS